MGVTWTTGAGGRTLQTGRATVPAGQMVSEPFTVAGHVADVTLSNPEFMVAGEFSDNRGWVAGHWEWAKHSAQRHQLLGKALLELINRGKTRNHDAF